MNILQSLMELMDASPVNFLAAQYVEEQLHVAGFIELKAEEPFPDMKAGDQYYVTKNGSAVFALRVGRRPAAESGFKLICAHSDSPGFRVKPHAAMRCEGNMVKLNTEVYGGPILYTWFDRPLGLAGRVMLRTDDPLHPVMQRIRTGRPLLVIPHLAIHFNRSVNEGNALSKQKDMLPVLGIINKELEADGILLDVIAQEAGCRVEYIIDFDLSLYDTEKGCLIGANNEFISCARLDNLSMIHAGMEGLFTSPNINATQMMVCFDNEEVGSSTRQGETSRMSLPTCGSSMS